MSTTNIALTDTPYLIASNTKTIIVQALSRQFRWVQSSTAPADKKYAHFNSYIVIPPEMGDVTIWNDAGNSIDVIITTMVK